MRLSPFETLSIAEPMTRPWMCGLTGARTLAMDNAGFSLIGVLSALAITSILITAIVSILVNMSSFVGRLEQKDQANDLSNEIRHLWNEQSLCTESMSGVNLVLNSTAANPQVVIMANQRLNNIRFQDYRPNHPFALREVRLEYVAGPFGGNRHFVRASLVVQSRRNNSNGLAFRPRTLSLVMDINATNRITRCAVDQTLDKPLTFIDAPIGISIYRYPPAKFALPEPNNWHYQSVQSLCPAGFGVVECFGNLGAPGTAICPDPTITYFSGDTTGPDHLTNVDLASVSYMLTRPNSTTCQMAVSAFFKGPTNSSYDRVRDAPFCVKARCVAVVP